MAKNRDPSFPFYVNDYMGDTKVQTMTWEQRGIYTWLLCIQWNDGSIPADEKELQALLHITPEKWPETWPAISRCFVPHKAGRLVNKRLRQELKAREAFKKTRSEAGKRGAKVLWDKKKNDTAMNLPMANDGSSYSSSITSSNSEKSNTRDVKKHLVAKPEPPQRVLSFEATRLCEELVRCIRINDDRAKLPDSFVWNNGWGGEARKLLENDGRPFEEAMSLIKWATEDQFWRANILSMGKFRKQYPQLRLKQRNNESTWDEDRWKRIADGFLGDQHGRDGQAEVSEHHGPVRGQLPHDAERGERDVEIRGA